MSNPDPSPTPNPLDYPQESSPVQRACSAAPWWVHVYGPDDVYEYADELEALREANALNRVILQNHEKHANDPNWPYAVAVVERQNDPSSPTKSA